MELLQLGVAPDEARQPARRQGLETCPRPVRTNKLVRRLGKATAFRGLRRRHVNMSLRKPQRLSTYEQSPGSCDLFKANSKVCCPAHNRVLLAHVAPCWPDNHLSEEFSPALTRMGLPNLACS